MVFLPFQGEVQADCNVIEGFLDFFYVGMVLIVYYVIDIPVAAFYPGTAENVKYLGGFHEL
jgi:hypothetical protein